MKFSAHLGKGAWALASRGLPFVYAVALILVQIAIPKDQFGTLSIFQTLFAMLFMFSDNFALQAIVKFGVEPEISIQALLTSSVSLLMLILVPITGLLLLFSQQVADLLKIPTLPTLLPAFALLAFLTVPRVVCSKMLQMRFRMRELFFVDFSNFGLSAIVVFVMLSRHQINNANDVVWVTVCSAFVSSCLAYIFVRKEVKLRPEFSRPMFTKIFEFVRFQAATGIVVVLQQQLDTLLVSGYTGAAGVATYQGAKILYRGFDALRDAMVLFLFPATSKYYSRGETDTVRRIIEKAIGFLYIILIPLGVILFIFAPQIYRGIWGTKYLDSIPVFRVLLCGVIILPFYMVLAASVVGMGKVKEMFRITTISLIFNVIVALVALPYLGPEGAALAFLSGITCQALLTYRYTASHIGLRARGLISGRLRDSVNFARELLKRE